MSDSIDFKFLANNIPLIVWTALPDGSVDYYNQNWYIYTGLPQGGGDGWTWQEVIHSEDVDELVKGWRESIELKKAYKVEFRIKRNDGEYKWFLADGVPYFNSKGEVEKWLGTCTDIHESKIREAHYRDDIQFLERITDSLPVLLYIYDLPSDKYIYGNKRAAEFTGIDNSNVNISSAIFSDVHLHPHDLERLIQRRNSFRNLKDGEVSEIEFRIKNVNGEWRWAQSHGVVFKRDDDGSVLQIIHSLRDIHEQKKLEQKLIHYKEFLTEVNEIVGVASYDRDIINDTVNFSHGVYNIFGLPEDTELTLPLLKSFILPEYIEIKDRLMRDAILRKETSISFEYKVFTYDTNDIKDLWGKIKFFYEGDRPVRIISTAIDITDQKKLEAGIVKYQHLLEEANELAGVASYDRDLINKIDLYSDGVYSIFGVPINKELSFEFLESLVLPEYRVKRKQLIAEAISKKTDCISFEYKICTYTSQEERDLWARVRIFYAGNTPIRMIGTAIDITEKNKGLQELKIARDHAVLANIQKRRFLANVSHEIRTPLNAILGFANLLHKRSYTREEENDFIGSIRASGKLLKRLIDDIIDISKIEEGSLTLANEKFKVKESFLNFCNSFKFSVNEKGIKYVINLSQDLPEHLVGDIYRLNQLTFNLISNALKFTKAGQIEVSISGDYIDIGKKGFKLIVKVTDTGIGIPENIQPYVFDQFFQGDNSVQRNYSGVGLGLCIVRNLVTLMGGEVFLESPSKASNYGPGTTIGFSVTLSVPEAGKVKEFVLGAAKQRFAKMVKVLVAEDNEMNQKLMGFLLKGMGCEVHIACNGQEAIDLIKRNLNPDVILMDIQMPVMDGYKATECLRKELLSNIPVIGVSADVFQEALNTCLKVGMDAHIAKPVNEVELFETMNTIINRVSKSNSAE